MNLRSSFSILFICLGTFGYTQLSGNQFSKNIVDDMLEGLGGKSLWRRAKAIEVNLDGYYVLEDVPWKEQFWIDFEQPRGKYIITSSTTNRLIAWDMQGGWEIRNGKFSKQEAANHKTEIEYYFREPTVIFHRLAAEEKNLKVEVDTTTQIMKLNILDSNTNKNICTFNLNKKREPIFWTAYFNNRQYKRILGPIKDFDNGLKMFAWGTTENGSWRYIHFDLKLLEEALQIEFEPPQNH